MDANYKNSGMNDIIFENRNKAYGAYVLRRDYNKSLGQAIFISTSIIVLLCAGKFISDKFSAGYIPPTENLLVATLSEVLPPVAPPISPPPPQPSHSAIVNTITNTEYQVKQNPQTPDSLPDQDQLNNINIGLTTTTGGTDVPGVSGDGGGTETAFTVAAPPVEQPVLTIAQIMPSFPGGEAALLRYLQVNTQYPGYENDLGIEGKALVKFVVNEDGSIVNAEVLRSETKGFAKEALRVVSTLPKFNPGMQNGRPARVQFVLPFSFKHKN